MEDLLKVVGEMFKNISIQQYEKAKLISQHINKLFEVKDKFVLSNQNVQPSIMWEPIKLVSYCYNPSFEVVNTWRLHTFCFTGNHLSYSIDNGHNPIPRDLEKRYINLIRGLPDKMITRPPKICGEMGWELNKGIVNLDVLAIQGHINLLYYSGVIDYLKSKNHVNILEIGGGYGGLAYFVKSHIPSSSYYMVDLVESLVFPSVYLGITMENYVDITKSIYDGSDKTALESKGKHFTFIPNFLINDMLETVKFDLVINTGSFGEMTEKQVQEYVNFINHTMTNDGILYEENQDTFIPVSSIIGTKLKNLSKKGLKKIWAKSNDISEKLDLSNITVNNTHETSWDKLKIIFRIRSVILQAIKRISDF